ncbi:MAG: SWIM zinc finger family protein, partial [Halobacteriales archaeon]|nr:SWIM zinc finger family protein [Halobacteriales archaeon]
MARGDQIVPVDATHFTVQSQSQPGTSYAVVAGRKGSCSCPFAANGGLCIHRLAVRLQADLRESAPEERRVACPKCRAKAIHYGVRQNKSGPVRLWLCKSCGHRFSGKEGFQRRRTDPKTIALALDLYFRGLSLRKVADHFEQ